jgi:hypothetical protein
MTGISKPFRRKIRQARTARRKRWKRFKRRIKGFTDELRSTNENIEIFLKKIGFSDKHIGHFMSSSTLDTSLCAEDYQMKCCLASPVYISTEIDLSPLTDLLLEKVLLNERLKALFPNSC